MLRCATPGVGANERLVWCAGGRAAAQPEALVGLVNVSAVLPCAKMQPARQELRLVWFGAERRQLLKV